MGCKSLMRLLMLIMALAVMLRLNKIEYNAIVIFGMHITVHLCNE